MEIHLALNGANVLMVSGLQLSHIKIGWSLRGVCVCSCKAL